MALDVYLDGPRDTLRIASGPFIERNGRDLQRRMLSIVVLVPEIVQPVAIATQRQLADDIRNSGWLNGEWNAIQLEGGPQELLSRWDRLEGDSPDPGTSHSPQRSAVKTDVGA